MAVEVRRLGPQGRNAALARLARDVRANLFLFDLVARVGSPPDPGELRTEVVCAWRGGELIGVAALRPSVVLDAHLDPEAIEAFVPYFEMLGVGLVKSGEPEVDRLWRRLRQGRPREAVVDRTETAYLLESKAPGLVECPEGLAVRPARSSDLEDLVVAARESLREEHRPDPFAGDVSGFRRWVRGRVDRARVVESQGSVVFVGYADVQRPEGWLLQGVYTFPEHRRRGLASAGVSDLCRQAFAAGADHAQLAVVDGNAAGRRLYQKLGFRPFARLRTILFS